MKRKNEAMKKSGNKHFYDNLPDDGADRRFYYDFETEIELDTWDVIEHYKDGALVKCNFSLSAGEYLFLAPCPPDELLIPRLNKLFINGSEICINKKQAKYVHSSFARYGINISLRDGVNEFIADVRLLKDGEVSCKKLYFTLQKAEEKPKPIVTKDKIHCVNKKEYKRNLEKANTEGWMKGIGHKVSSGRFGFSKGDGLLDCAMPSLGVVDKMFLCGQPKYKKPYRWSYSLLPDGMPLYGTYEPKDKSVTSSNVQVNHLSVKWTEEYQGNKFSCSYSLASPAILTESDMNVMYLSGLNFAGNYQSILIPRKDGVEEVELDKADISNMAENWVLLFNSTEFPDVPIMLVFDRNPEAMRIYRDKNNRLKKIEFIGCPMMLSCTPFGIERFDREGMPIQKAIERCQFWSRALLAFPVSQSDYFQLDEEKEKVTIRQAFEYRYIKDAWGTEPLEIAPLPPATSLCGVAHSKDCFNLEFPTKYGWMLGIIGTWSQYTLPMMPKDRKFPLCDKNSKIPQLLKEDIEKYQKVAAAFPMEIISYPYAGAILEPFSFASTLSFFMDEKDRQFLQKHIKERLPFALDASAKSNYVVIDWGELMQNQPEHDGVIDYYTEKKNAKKCLPLRNWYQRIEPFTGATFTICYLNVYYISTGQIKTGEPEEILGLKIPLIENDWGVGLTLYYMYLSALQIGSFDEIRKNWELIKGVYSFFELMHDWACMGTGYSDNAVTWVEGANHGLFTSYIHMAEAVGDEKERAFGIYNAAKQMALRLAIINSSHEYFPKYFEVEPWYCTKCFHEEFCPKMAFQNAPYLLENRYRRDAVYNFTTEGLYPETYENLRRFGGGFYAETMRRLEQSIQKLNEKDSLPWTSIQQYAGMLIDKALDENCKEDLVEKLLQEGEKNGLLMQDWRGIHIFSRVLPKNYLLCQIRAWLEMRKHKLWLENWEEMNIFEAVYEKDRAKICFTHSKLGIMKLQCGVKQKPKAVLLNGEVVDFNEYKNGKIKITPSTDGVLEILF